MIYSHDAEIERIKALRDMFIKLADIYNGASSYKTDFLEAQIIKIVDELKVN